MLPLMPTRRTKITIKIWTGDALLKRSWLLYRFRGHDRATRRNLYNRSGEKRIELQ